MVLMQASFMSVVQSCMELLCKLVRWTIMTLISMNISCNTPIKSSIYQVFHSTTKISLVGNNLEQNS